MSVSRRALFMRCVAVAPVVVATIAGCATSSPRPGEPLVDVDSRGIAMQGYDPVSYFPEGGGIPQPGSSDVVARHSGAIYRFAGERSRKRFLDRPTRYVPLYGGWDAWSMVSGQRETPDPTNFLIRDEHLLLFMDGVFVDGREKWLERDHRALREKADQAWFALLSKAGS